MYFEFTERVTDRRLAMNKTNTALCLIITAGIGVTLSWAHDKKELLPFALLITLVISILATLFCRWWCKAIVDLKDLNSAKFDVLKAMAPNVKFSEGSLQSFLPLDKEWKILENAEKLQPYKGGFALKASRSELIVPTSFMVVYALAMATCITMFITKRYDQALLAFIL